MKVYTQKPFFITAVQWKGNNLGEIKNFCVNDSGRQRYFVSNNDLWIMKKRGQSRASIKDYIIRGTDGEFDIFPEFVFNNTFGLVPDVEWDENGRDGLNYGYVGNDTEGYLEEDSKEESYIPTDYKADLAEKTHQEVVKLNEHLNIDNLPNSENENKPITDSAEFHEFAHKKIPVKSLHNTTANGAKKNVKDIQFWGDGDTFKLISKASSENEGWMKSTKAMEIDGVGCVVQVTTQQRNPDGSYSLSDAVTFVPNAKIEVQKNEAGETIGRKLISNK